MTASLHSAFATGLSTVVPLISVLLLCSCSSTTHLNSRSLDRTIVVDGSEDDWHGLLGRLEDTDLTVGFVNDQEYLYVTVVARDQRSVRQIMMSGLVVWLSDSGKKEEKTLGIGYPLGVEGSGITTRGPQGGSDPSALEDAFRAGLGQMEILGKNGEGRLADLLSVTEIAARATVQYGTIVYELKVPLVREEDRIGVGATPGAVIAVGLETPELDRSAMRARMRDGGGRGGSSGAMGGFGGGAGGMGGGSGMGGARGGMSPPQRLDKWVRVTLAG